VGPLTGLAAAAKTDANHESDDEATGSGGKAWFALTGKLSARPAGKPGDFFIVKGEFATIPSSPLYSCSIKNHY
jgi:hypothetical protein